MEEPSPGLVEGIPQNLPSIAEAKLPGTYEAAKVAAAHPLTRALPTTPHREVEYRENSGSTERGVARRLLKQRLGEMARGRLVGPKCEVTTVDELLEDLVVDLRIKGRASLRTVQAHVTDLLGHLANARAVDVTTARLNRIVQAWQEEGTAPATINKRFATLRRSFTLGREAEPPKVTVVPRFPRLPEHNAREGFFNKGEFFAVLDGLPDDGLRDFCEWAFWTGMRQGELGRLEWAAFDRETWTLTPLGAAGARATRTGKFH